MWTANEIYAIVAAKQQDLAWRRMLWAYLVQFNMS